MSTKNVGSLKVGRTKDRFLKAHFCRPSLVVRSKKPTTWQKLAHKKQNFTRLERRPWAESHRMWAWKQANPNSYSYTAVLHYTEVVTDHELCYYYCVTMDALRMLKQKACTIRLYDFCVIRAWFNWGLSV